MSQAVIVILGQSPSDPLAYAVADDGVVFESGEAATIADIRDAVGADVEDLDIVAVLPGEQVAMRTLPSPPRQASKLRGAAQFLLEDELASPIENSHIAVLRKDAVAHIAAIDLSLIERWTTAFAEHDLPLSVLTTDFACLPAAEDEGVMFFDGARLIVNFGDKGFAAPPDLAKRLIADFFADHPEGRIGVYSPKGATLSDQSRYERLGESSRDVFFKLISEAVADNAAVNLLQGPFRPPRRALVDVVRWRRPAALAASLIAVLLAGVFADGFRASRLADQYANEAQRIHNEAFPTAASADIRAHARSVLGAGGPGASFLAISDILGRALETHENVAIDRVRYEQSRGRYVFSVRSDSDAEIAAFQQTLAALGASAAETGGYRRSGAYWIGDMAVTLS